MSARKAKSEKRATDESGEISSLFFKDGREGVRQRLVEAVREARLSKGIAPNQLDEMCFFKNDDLATCNEFEQDPSKMTQEIFCRAACALGLKIDEVLKLRLTQGKLEAVLEAMESTKGGLVAALHTKEASPVEDAKVAPVYARFKILSEI